MDFERDQSPGYVVNHLGRAFAKALQKEIRPFGASIGQFPILLLLWTEDGLAQGEISRRLGIEQATVTNTLNRMERDGLIERLSDPHDLRRTLVNASAKAHALEADLIRQAMDVNARATQGIAAADVDTFMAVARAMIENLQDEA